MNRTGAVIIFLIVLGYVAQLRAAEDNAGTTSPFGLGAGCRSIAMGGAASAVWGDSYALFWNPAGLSTVERNEVNLFHTSLFDESATYSAFAVSHPFLELGVLSIGMVQLRVGGIEQRNAENVLLEEEIKNVQTRYVLGYARDIVKGLAAGIELKLDRFAQGTNVANGFGIDAGFGLETAVHSPAFDGIAMGVSLRNVIEPTIDLVNQETGDPRGIRVGFAVWKSIAPALQDRLTISVDADKTKFSNSQIHVGAEYSLKNIFAVRGGWDKGIPTFGCGFKVPFMLLDYAYRSTELGGNHLFSLAFRFGSSRSERSEEARKRREEGIRKELEAQITSYENQAVTSDLEAARECLAKKDYAGALGNFRRVLLWSPANEQAEEGVRSASVALSMARGDSLMMKGEFAEALLSYRESQKSMRTSQAADRISACEKRMLEASNKERMKSEMLARAVELYTERSWADAALGFEEVLAMDPQSSFASDYLVRARAKMREQYEKTFADADRLAAESRYGAALQLLKMELEKTPGDARLAAKVSEIGELQKNARMKKLREVEGEAQKRIITQEEMQKLQPAYDRGIESFKRGDFASAILEWEPVWRTAPQFEKVTEYLVKAYQYLGMEQYARHEYEKALETWDKILGVDPDNEKALRYINKTKEELSRLEGLTNR